MRCKVLGLLQLPFQEWTLQVKRGLEITLVAIILPFLWSMVFGNVNPEYGNLGMARCVTVHQLWAQCGITSLSGDVCHSTA